MMSTTGSWPKTIFVVLWNSVSIWNAFRTRPIYGTADFIATLRQWLTNVSPLFLKVAQATPFLWDDKIAEAIETLLEDRALFSSVERNLQLGETVPNPATRMSLRERLRGRLLRGKTDVVSESEIEMKTESLSMAVMILSLIASSTGIWTFIRNLRKQFQKTSR